MYYEEKIINDVLCTRGTPDGELIPLSQVALTSRIAALRAERDEAVRLLMIEWEDVSKHGSCGFCNKVLPSDHTDDCQFNAFIKSIRHD